MRNVKQKGSKPELAVRHMLHSLGYRFRLHRKDYPGTPDIVLPKYRTVVFVHGCFWHGHDCRKGKLPATRRKFWKTKITKNKARDVDVTKALEGMGYQVLVVWECQLKDKEALAAYFRERLPKEN